MKIFLKILILAFLFIGFSCSILLADNGELLSVYWEKKVNGRIWRGYVLHSQIYVPTMNIFRLNALCDYKAFEETSRMRRVLLSAVGGDISGRRVSTSTEICGYVLERYTLFCIAPLRVDERVLLSRVLLEKRMLIDISIRLAEEERGNKDKTLVVSSAALNVNSQRGDISRDCTNRRNKDYGISSLDMKVNLRIYSLHFDKVDYFRLILYLWEDNPFENNKNNISNFCPCTHFTHLVLHNFQDRVTGKPLQNNFNKFNKNRTDSVVSNDESLDSLHDCYLLHASLIGELMGDLDAINNSRAIQFKGELR